MILVSACLLGCACRYDGQSKLHPLAQELCRRIEAEGARAVMLCGIPSSLRNDLVKYCIDRGVEAYVRPNIGDFLIKGARSLSWTVCRCCCATGPAPPSGIWPSSG